MRVPAFDRPLAYPAAPVCITTCCLLATTAAFPCQASIPLMLKGLSSPTRVTLAWCATSMVMQCRITCRYRFSLFVI